MQFLSDVYIRCPDCNGKRYRKHILEVKISAGVGIRMSNAGVRTEPENRNPNTLASKRKEARSIADVLDSTVEEAIEFLSRFSDSRPAQRAAESLKLLAETGLGYLKLGQPINTLSGGESQRLKLVRHLAEFAAAPKDASARPTLFLFDEPTTGLHFDDVRVLLKVFRRLASEGHSVLVIEHNIDVINSADWILDLGPDAGDEGGRIVAQGTRGDIMACAASHTGRALGANLRPGGSGPEFPRAATSNPPRGTARVRSRSREEVGAK
jgi:excinuclease ABC subunit A